MFSLSLWQGQKQEWLSLVLINSSALKITDCPPLPTSHTGGGSRPELSTVHHIHTPHTPYNPAPCEGGLRSWLPNIHGKVNPHLQDSNSLWQSCQRLSPRPHFSQAPLNLLLNWAQTWATVSVLIEVNLAEILL